MWLNRAFKKPLVKKVMRLKMAALNKQLEEEAIDVTLPGRRFPGNVHPVTRTIER